MDRKFRGVTARGNRIQISFTYKGERCREILPMEPTAKNLKEAYELRQMILTRIKFGKFDYADDFPNSKKAIRLSPTLAGKVTIEEALNKWLRAHQRHIETSTARGYASSLREHLIPSFGHISLTDLTATDVRNWIAKQTVSNKRINNVLIPLRAIYADAHEEEIIDKNPLTRIKNLNVVTREPHPFNVTEVAAILNELIGNDKNLIQFAFETGLRTSELIGLNWEDVDIKKKRIYVRRAIVYKKEKAPKTRSGIRTVELTEQALLALEAQKLITVKEYKGVFCDTRVNDRLTDQKIRKRIWIPALKRAGIEYRSPYQTRHTFASQRLSDGKSIIWVSTQMGHSSPIMTAQAYARWIQD